MYIHMYIVGLCGGKIPNYMFHVGGGGRRYIIILGV